MDVSNVNSTQAGVFVNSTETLLALEASTRTQIEVSVVTQIQGGATITAAITNNIVQVFPVTTQTVILQAPPAQTQVGGQAQAPGVASTVTLVTVVTAAAGVPCQQQIVTQTVTELLTLTVTASAEQSVVLNPGAASPLQANGSDIALVNGTAPLALGTGTGASSQPATTVIIVEQEAEAQVFNGKRAERLRERRVRRGPRGW